MAAIDSQNNFIIKLDEDIQIFIPQPSKYEVIAISKVLGHIFKEIVNGEAVNVLVVDWERFIDEASSSLNDAQKADLNAKIHAFLDKCISSGICFRNSQFKPILDAKLEEELMHNLKGTLLFILALFRYASTKIKTTFLKDFTTSQTSTEWKTSLEKSIKSSAEPTSLEESRAVQVLERKE